MGPAGLCRCGGVFFGPHAQIVGIDIRQECERYSDDQIAVRIGDQKDSSFLNTLITEFGAFDVIIDDGSHAMADIFTTFSFMYPRMSKNGVYFVEDLHTAYRSAFGGGLRREGTFVEVCKGLIDELHADYTNGALAPTDFTRHTLSMHIYDSAIVLERGTATAKVSIITGEGMSPKVVGKS